MFQRLIGALGEQIVSLARQMGEVSDPRTFIAKWYIHSTIPEKCPLAYARMRELLAGVTTLDELHEQWSHSARFFKRMIEVRYEEMLRVWVSEQSDLSVVEAELKRCPPSCRYYLLSSYIPLLDEWLEGSLEVSDLELRLQTCPTEAWYCVLESYEDAISQLHELGELEACFVCCARSQAEKGDGAFPEELCWALCNLIESRYAQLVHDQLLDSHVDVKALYDSCPDGLKHVWLMYQEPAPVS